MTQQSIASMCRSLGIKVPKVVSRGRRGRRHRFSRGGSLEVESMGYKTNNEIFLGLTDLSDLVVTKLYDQRASEGLDTDCIKLSLHSHRNQWTNFLSNTDMLDDFVMSCRSNSGFLTSEQLIIQYFIHSKHVDVEIMGAPNKCAVYEKLFSDEFEVVENEIEWVYAGDGSSITVPMRSDLMPVKEMYPFLGETSLEEYYDNFMNSRASILLLIGPPGTGKTTFIRGLLQHTNTSAIVSYDPSVLEKDYVFAGFIGGDKDLMVLEDADMFLKSRKEGNTMMHKFLNVGDGLVTTHNKKLIFSTNLPSISDVDPALIRPGRCYDIVEFSELTQDQAQKLADKTGTKLSGVKERWSIAEVFHNANTTPTKKLSSKTLERKMGFV